MNSKLYQALENCLEALEKGQTLEAVLKRYPDLAPELRPILEASFLARTSGRNPAPQDVLRRSRARLLQHAAQLRESRRPASRRLGIPAFSRLTITLMLVAILALSSTGLVSASSGALPGDQLYPVKRTWEGVRLLLIFSPGGRDILESEYEQERLDEIDELLARGRSAPISFSGLVTKQQDGKWLVSGIPVALIASSRLPSGPITDGAPVMVTGLTRADGLVEAQEIQLLEPGVRLPPFEPSENGDHGNDDQESSPGSAPVAVETPASSGSGSQGSEPDHTSYKFSGVVESMQDQIWNINGQSVSVAQAEIDGDVTVGSLVKFEGYYDSTGHFIVTKIEVKSSNDSPKGDQSGSSSSEGDSSGPGGGDDGGSGSDDGH
jgi:uncharacterized membrane protein YgcG